MLARLFTGIVLLEVLPAGAETLPRIAVVGSAAGPIADALRVELDLDGIEVVVRRAPPLFDTRRIDLRARAAALDEIAARSGAMGAAEVILRQDAAALLLYRSRVDAVTRSRAVRVSDPPSDQDYRSLALVLRSMIRGAVAAEGLGRSEELDSLVRRVGPPRPRVQVRGRRSAPAPVLLWAAMGYAGWTRLDGSFFWQGPVLAVRLGILGFLEIEARAALSFEAVADSRDAEVRVSDSVLGLWSWVAIVRTDQQVLAVGAGADGHRLVAYGAVSGGLDARLRERAVVAPMVGLEWSFKPTPSFRVLLRLAGGYSSGYATYTIRGDPVLTEGRFATDATLAIGLPMH